MDDLKRVEDIIKLITNSLTKEDFIKAFSQVIKLVQDLKKTNEKEFALIHQAVKAFQNKLDSDTSLTLSEMKSKVNEIISDKFSKMFEEHKKEMYLEMEMEMDKMHEEMNCMPSKEEILKEAEQTPAQLRDKLESLKDGEKLSIQAIQDLSKILQDLEKKMLSGIEGVKGQKYGSIRTQYFDDETPEGTKNGVNTDFTLKFVPAKNSLKIYRNGVRQRITEDYTLSSRTITFLIAPASAEIILVDYRR